MFQNSLALARGRNQFTRIFLGVTVNATRHWWLATHHLPPKKPSEGGSSGALLRLNDAASTVGMAMYPGTSLHFSPQPRHLAGKLPALHAFTHYQLEGEEQGGFDSGAQLCLPC